MLPKLFTIGGFYLPTYGVLVAVAFLVALWMTSRLAKFAGLPAESVLNLGVTCALAGIVGAKVLMIALDPVVKRRQKGLTFLFCWAVSAGTSAALWWAIDPEDPLKVRLPVSIVFGAFGFFAYPPLAGWLSAKFPAIGSAWDGIKGGKS